MDFTPTEEQQALTALAAEILADLSTHERLTAAGTGTDHELWKALCAAGLPGAVAQTGLLGLVLLAEEQGRYTAQVPLTAHAAFGILPVMAQGSDEQRERLLPGLLDGTAVTTGAFAPGTVATRDMGTWRLHGTQPVVPWLRDATHVVVRADDRCFLVTVASEEHTGAERAGAEWTGVERAGVETTAPWAAGRLVLDGAPGDPLGAAEPVLAAARTAFAGLQAGVCAGALARAVEYTSVREQFGRPLSANQGVLLRAADAYMDTESIRVTAYEAAWRADSGLDAAPHVLTAAWWASEAGTRVVHACQHLHGGVGADLEHPVHRHFLWGRQLGGYLGSGAEVLQELGALLASGGAG